MPEVEELSYAECRGLLAGGVFGRLAICTAEGPLITPVNYSVVEESVVFRTTPYGLVAAHDWGGPMAFEVDHVDYGEQRGWSVVAFGPAERVEDDDELELIKRTWDPRPWASGARPLYVRLEWTRLTGRRLGTGWTHDNEMPIRRHL